MLDLAATREWMPIDTAPKDGPAFLVWCPDRLNIYLVASDHEDGMWYVFGGRRLENQIPTHWMPLPSPPQAAKSEITND